MQQDDLVWQVINHGFCSFKAKVGKEQTFCRNEYNVTGLCSKQACPLANSRYATVREHNGLVYLYLKTAERAHTPKNLWEKIELPRSYAKALEIIDSQLEFASKFSRHRCKQRLTKIHQYLIRMRKLRKKMRPRLVGVTRKVEQRERRREEKALKAAHIEKTIENELLERLKQGTYSGIYNYPEQQYANALKEVDAQSDVDEDEEYEDEDDEGEYEEEYEDEDDNRKGEVLTGKVSKTQKVSKSTNDDSNEPLNVEYVVGDFGDDDDDDDDDLEDADQMFGSNVNYFEDDDSEEMDDFDKSGSLDLEEDDDTENEDENDDTENEDENDHEKKKRKRVNDGFAKSDELLHRSKLGKNPRKFGPYIEIEYEEEEDDEQTKIKT